MATDVQNPTDQSLTSLVGGIVTDVQSLLDHQIKLTRHEIQTDIRHFREAASVVALGGLLAFLGLIPLVFALAYLIFALAPSIPLWACFALVGLPLTAVGGLIAWQGMKKVETIKPLDQSAQAVQETVQWKTDPNQK